MTSLPIKTGAGAQANVSTTLMPDGSVAINHVTVNADGSAVVPAQDATLQAATTALQTLAATLTGYVETDPGTF